LGNTFIHPQEHQTVHYSLWYVVPNMLPVDDLVMEITDRQRIGYNTPQAVVYSLMLPRMGKSVAQNMSS